VSKPIFQNLPEAQQLLELRTEELAGYLMEHFHSLSFGQRQQAMAHNLANDISSRYHARKDEVYQAISIACQWLINRGFLAPVGPQGILVTTDEGSRTTTAADLRSYLRGDETASQSIQKPLRETGLSNQPSAQNSKSSTGFDQTHQTNLVHANELYQKVKRLIHETKSLDEKTATLIVELADDAIKEFGNTNQEKKVELRQIRTRAESVLPPETLEELRKRAEGRYLRSFYPKSPVLRWLLLGIIGLGVMVSILLGFYKTLFGGSASPNSVDTRPSPTLNPSSTLSPSPTPIVSPNPIRASPEQRSLPAQALSADQRAGQLKQEAARLMNSGKYKEAISKLNQALRINGISASVESELKNLRIEAVTMASNQKNAP